jgi:nucleoside-diphosphate-sugar epimerase
MAGKLNVVTGATGLLGSHIAEQLVARSERVRALVRPSSDVAFLRQLGVELVTADLQDPTGLAEAVAGADIVYHCAARVGDWGSWADFRTQVIDVTRNLVAACHAGGIGRLLHVSSVSVYGHPRPKKCITEDEPHGQRLRLLDHYCRAKMQAEALAWELRPAVTRRATQLDLWPARPQWSAAPGQCPARPLGQNSRCRR